MGYWIIFSLKSEIIGKYLKSFTELKQLVNKYKELEAKKDELIKKRNFLDFELKEINNVNVTSGEDTELENELKRLEILK